jgi:hypothetical protein
MAYALKNLLRQKEMPVKSNWQLRLIELDAVLGRVEAGVWSTAEL